MVAVRPAAAIDRFDGRRAAKARLFDEPAQNVAQAIRELCIESEPVERKMHGASPVVVPVFGDLDGCGIARADALGQMLRDEIAAVVFDSAYLVVAEAIGVVFVNEEERVVDQGLRLTVLPIRKDRPDPDPVGEVEAAVRVRACLPVIEPDAVVVEPAPVVMPERLVVDLVEDDGDSGQVAQVDEALDLVDAPGRTKPL
jgi:hypothetical protein